MSAWSVLPRKPPCCRAMQTEEPERTPEQGRQAPPGSQTDHCTSACSLPTDVTGNTRTTPGCVHRPVLIHPHAVSMCALSGGVASLPSGLPTCLHGGPPKCHTIDLLYNSRWQSQIHPGNIAINHGPATGAGLCQSAGCGSDLLHSAAVRLSPLILQSPHPQTGKHV